MFYTVESNVKLFQLFLVDVKLFENAVGSSKKLFSILFRLFYTKRWFFSLFEVVEV